MAAGSKKIAGTPMVPSQRRTVAIEITDVLGALSNQPGGTVDFTLDGEEHSRWGNVELIDTILRVLAQEPAAEIRIRNSNRRARWLAITPPSRCHIDTLCDDFLVTEIFSRLPIHDRFSLELVSSRWARLARESLWPAFTAHLDMSALPEDSWQKVDVAAAKCRDLFARCGAWLVTLDITGSVPLTAILGPFVSNLQRDGFPMLRHLIFTANTPQPTVTVSSQSRALKAIADHLPRLKSLSVGISFSNRIPTADYFACFRQLEALIFHSDGGGEGVVDSITALPPTLKYLELRLHYIATRNNEEEVTDTRGTTAVVDNWVEVAVRNNNNTLVTLRIVAAEKICSLDAPTGGSARAVRLISQLDSLRALQLPLLDNEECHEAFASQLCPALGRQLVALSLTFPSIRAIRAIAMHGGTTLKHLSLCDVSPKIEAELKGETFDQPLEFPAMLSFKLMDVPQYGMFAVVPLLRFRQLERIHTDSSHIFEKDLKHYLFDAKLWLLASSHSASQLYGISKMLVEREQQQQLTGVGTPTPPAGRMLYHYQTSDWARAQRRTLPCVNVIDHLPPCQDLQMAIFGCRSATALPECHRDYYDHW